LLRSGPRSLYIADSNNGKIRKLSLDTGMVETVAGKGAAMADGPLDKVRFSLPYALASDGDETLYVGEGDGRLRQVSFASGLVQTVELSGQYSRLLPPGLASAGGDLYIAGISDAEILKFSLSTRQVSTFVGAREARGSADGKGSAARFNTFGSGLTVETAIVSDGSGTIYLGDRGNGRIRKVVVATGVVTTLAGTTMGEPVDGVGAAARFCVFTDMVGDGAGSLYVFDGCAGLRRVTLATGAVQTLGFYPEGGGLRSIVSDGPGSLYGLSADSIQRYDIATGSATTLVSEIHGSTLTIDAGGRLYVGVGGSIQVVETATGAVSTLVGVRERPGYADGFGTAAALTAPTALITDGHGNLYLADTKNHTLRKVVIATGELSTLVGMPNRSGVLLGALPAGLNAPTGVAPLAASGELLIADENSLLLARF
jgi:hypothetical protein